MIIILVVFFLQLQDDIMTLRAQLLEKENELAEVCVCVCVCLSVCICVFLYIHVQQILKHEPNWLKNV